MGQSKLSGTLELGGVRSGYFVRLIDLSTEKRKSSEQVKIGKVEYLKCERKFKSSTELKNFLGSIKLEEQTPSNCSVMLSPGTKVKFNFSETTLEHLLAYGLLKEAPR